VLDQMAGDQRVYGTIGDREIVNVQVDVKVRLGAALLDFAILLL
jgi:hypothetical protein